MRTTEPAASAVSRAARGAATPSHVFVREPDDPVLPLVVSVVPPPGAGALGLFGVGDGEALGGVAGHLGGVALHGILGHGVGDPPAALEGGKPIEEPFQPLPALSLSSLPVSLPSANSLILTDEGRIPS